LGIPAPFGDQVGHQNPAVALLAGRLHPDRVVGNHRPVLEAQEIAQRGARLGLSHARQVDDRRRAVGLDGTHGAAHEHLVVPLRHQLVDRLRGFLALFEIAALQLADERLGVVGGSAAQDDRRRSGQDADDTAANRHDPSFSWTVASLTISYCFVPPGVLIVTSSPTRWPTSALPIGEVTETRPLAKSAMSGITSSYVMVFPDSASTSETDEPRAI